jgi:hypothetical protein
MPPTRSDHDPPPLRPDGATRRWLRPLRALNEAIALIRPTEPLPFDELIASAPRANGHAVLVLPASLRDDGQTAPIRDFLSATGYQPYGWDLGINLGPTASLLAGAMKRLETLSDRHGPVSVVGFSMAGCLRDGWACTRRNAFARSLRCAARSATPLQALGCRLIRSSISGPALICARSRARSAGRFVFRARSFSLGPTGS